MKGEIEQPVIAKLVMFLLESLFYNVIRALETDSTQHVVYSKQVMIRKCFDDIMNFVNTNPYGKFSLEVLDATTKDLKDPLMSVSFKNYIHELPNLRPLVFHIILDETHSTFRTFQSSIDGEHLIEINSGRKC
jgi:hypothetical protein